MSKKNERLYIVCYRGAKPDWQYILYSSADLAVKACHELKSNGWIKAYYSETDDNDPRVKEIRNVN